jgi:hypothetical protein
MQNPILKKPINENAMPFGEKYSKKFLEIHKKVKIF